MRTTRPHRTPDEQVADARARLDEANRRLLADITDAEAITLRDEALVDLEEASARRQRVARLHAIGDTEPEPASAAWSFWLLLVVTLIVTAWALVFVAGVAVGRWTA